MADTAVKKTTLTHNLRSLGDFASRIQPIAGLELYRIFKIYHPIWEAETNITVREMSSSYHVLEQFMDLLVCGNATEPGHHCRIRSKEELLALMGINYEAYEIASLYFDDLVRCGHFYVDNKGIHPLQSAFDSAKTVDRDIFSQAQAEAALLEDLLGNDTQTPARKTAVKFTNRQIHSGKLFDQYTGQLLPACFYELDGFFATPAEIRQRSNAEQNALWLPLAQTILDAATDLEMGFARLSDDEATHREKGLPQGFDTIRLIPGTQPQLKYCAYYLAVYLRGDGSREYRVHDPLLGNEIPWMSRQYNQAEAEKTAYLAAVDLVRQLCLTTERGTVFSPIFANWPLQLRGHTARIFGYNEIENGNYSWDLQQWQFPELLRMCRNKEKRHWVRFALQNTWEVLDRFMAGRLVQIRIREEFRTALLEELQQPFTVTKTPPREKNLDTARLRIILNQQGEPGSQEWQTIVAMLEDAMEEFPDAGFWLGQLYLKADAHQTALQVFRQSAKAGYAPSALFAMGEIWREDREKDQKIKEVIALVKQLSKDSFAPGCYIYGMVSKWVNKPAIAEKMFRMAAEQNFRPAIQALEGDESPFFDLLAELDLTEWGQRIQANLLAKKNAAAESAAP